MAERFGCFSALKVIFIWLAVAFCTGFTIAEIDGNHGSIGWLLLAMYAGAAGAIVHVAIRLIARMAK
jgi:hypothetical protein